jgi:dCTP deaminase
LRAHAGAALGSRAIAWISNSIKNRSRIKARNDPNGQPKVARNLLQPKIVTAILSARPCQADLEKQKMILTGSQIKQAVRDGDITISRFDSEFIEPNSYGFHLGNELAVYTEAQVDAFGCRAVDYIRIPDSGYVLRPSFFYLGHTLEQMGSRIYAAELYARLSTSLCGMFIQTSAPLGHTGAIISWTLEIVASQPVRIYSGMLIGKICFWRSHGQISPYAGRYSASNCTVPSRLSMVDQ